MSLLTPSHTLNESRHTQGSSSVQYLVTLRSTGRFYDRLLWLDFSVSWLDWIFGPGAVEFHSCLLFLCLSTPLLQRSAGGRGRWPAMFLALVMTPELREFLARARGGAVRFIKVRIQDGEWHMTVWAGAIMWMSWPSVGRDKSSMLLVFS